MDERAEKEAKREDEERGRAWIGTEMRQGMPSELDSRAVGNLFVSVNRADGQSDPRRTD